MERWRGKVAVVTGISSGIGEAVVRDLVKHGMKVAGLARRIDRIAKLEEELKGSEGELKGIACDVCDPVQIESAFQWVEDNWGGVSVLVNNAGYMKVHPLPEMDIEEIRQMFNTNVIGYATCAKAAVKSMREHDHEGCVINIGSVSGHEIFLLPGVGAYGSTKYAIKAYTEYLRHELSLVSEKIRVMSISPGVVMTEMIDEFKSFIPPGAATLTPEDISYTVTFMISSPVSINFSDIIMHATSESLLKLFANSD